MSTAKKKIKAEIKFRRDERTLKATIPLKPGLVVLRGKQGIGKSTLLKALAFTFGDDLGDLPDDAVVTFDDEVVVVNHRKSKDAYECPLVLSDTLRCLIDSGAKMKKTRGKDRIKALYSLIDITDDKAEDILKKMGFESSLIRKILESKPVNSLGRRWKITYDDFISRVKRGSDGLARDLEDSVERIQGRLEHLVGVVEQTGYLNSDVSVNITTIKKAIKLIERELPIDKIEEGDTIDEYLFRSKTQFDNSVFKYRARVENKEELKEQLEDLDEEEGTTEDVLDKQKSVVRVMIGTIKKLETEQKIIEDSLNGLRQKLSAEKEKGRSIKHMLDHRKRISEGGLGELEKDKENLKMYLDAQARNENERDHLDAFNILSNSLGEIEVVNKDKKLKKSQAEKIRNLNFFSDSTDFDLLGMFGLNNTKVKVIDSHVFLPLDGEYRNMDEMSEGEKVKCAFNLITGLSTSNRKTIFVDRKLFSALQPENKELVIRELCRRKIVGLTEEPTDSEELEITHYTKDLED